MTRTHVFAAVAVVSLSIFACSNEEKAAPTTDDSTLYLTGTEEAPIVTDGGLGCTGKKVLVCHIPPGNPANAHTICVGAPAVKAHAEHHGDPEGACAETDAGTPPPTGGGEGDDDEAPDAGPIEIP